MKNIIGNMNKEKIIENYKTIHKLAELSWEEYETTQYIYNELIKIGYSPKICSKKLGVIADLNPEKERRIALRADMDALPITEQTDLEFKAKKNMHSCGHDAHTSIALGVARELYKVKDSIGGGIRFIFQPSEETGEGARYMVKEGALEKVESVFSCHLWGTLDIGEVNIEAGARMASCDNFKIEVNGLGAHGAEPHLGADAILGASQLVVALQQIVSREISPMEKAVVTIGTINGGNRYNIISSKVTLEGTARALSHEIRGLIEDRINEITDYTCKTYKCSGSVSYTKAAEILINDKKLSNFIKNQIEEEEGINLNNDFPPLMAAEDFPVYAENIPGAFVFIGVRDEERGMIYPNHHPKFFVSEESLYQGVKIFTKVLTNYFKEN